jgi:hypothetical protein
MRRFSLITVAVCLMAAPLFGQSRHRGYNANGGWHLKASAPTPARRLEARKPKPPKNKETKTPPAPAQPQKF